MPSSLAGNAYKESEDGLANVRSGGLCFVSVVKKGRPGILKG